MCAFTFEIYFEMVLRWGLSEHNETPPAELESQKTAVSSARGVKGSKTSKSKEALGQP